jgi:hypothetical protein
MRVMLIRPAGFAPSADGFHPLVDGFDRSVTDFDPSIADFQRAAVISPPPSES